MTSFSALLRPGVQFKTNVVDVLPDPLSNHAIAYMFVSVPGSAWDSKPENYTELRPLTPTIISSVNDYVSKIGGKVPNPLTDYPSFISYKAVEKFFLTSGGQGVLYVIRTVITPQVKVTLLPSAANARYFTVKIDGVYFGSENLNRVDSDGISVFAIRTSGLDLADNTYDVKAALEGNEFFSTNYEIENNPLTSSNGVLYFSSKNFGATPKISVFEIPDPQTNLLSTFVSGATIEPLVNTRELSFRLVTDEKVHAIDGNVFDRDYYTKKDSLTNDFQYFVNSAATPSELSALINKYLIDKGVYAQGNALSGTASGLFSISTTGFVASDVYVAITQNPSVTFTPVTETGSGTTPATRNTASVVTYYEAVVASGVVTWNPVSLPVLTPKTVQAYALNVDNPSNRFVITSNGATSAEHRDNILPKLVTAIDDANYVLTPKTTVTRGYQTLSGISATSTALIPQTLENGLNTWDLVHSIEIASNISIPKYIWNGTNTQGSLETNFFNVLDNSLGLLAQYGTPRVRDYVNAIENGVRDPNLLPGFLLCPEAYARYSTLKETSSAADLKTKRLAVSASLRKVAKERDWFALIDDNPDSLNAQQSSQEFDSILNTIPSSGGYYGFYYPHVIDFEERLIPASPFVAGIALARYTNEGFREPPAGIEYPLAGALRPKYTVSSSQQEVNSFRGMNPLVFIPNSGVVVYGARTSATSTPVQFVNSRVIANIALQSLKNSFNGFVFNALETDNQAVFDRINTTAIGILQELYDVGALIGETPGDAYVVICNETNNRSSNLSQGIIYCFIEFAPASTLERLVISINITSAGQVGAKVTNL